MRTHTTTVRGKLTLEISGVAAVNLGYLDIPIEVQTDPDDTGADLDARGELILRSTPNMREVRELIEQVFTKNANEGKP